MALVFVTTDRGFARGEFKDHYNNSCSIQKSSLASEDCIWLGADDITTAHGCGPLNTRMHLTRQMVADLLPFLQWFVDTGELR